MTTCPHLEWRPVHERYDFYRYATDGWHIRLCRMRDVHKKRARKSPGSGHIGEMAVFFHVSLAIAALILAMAASIFSMLLAKEILMESGSPNARPVTVDTCA